MAVISETVNILKNLLNEIKDLDRLEKSLGCIGAGAGLAGGVAVVKSTSSLSGWALYGSMLGGAVIGLSSGLLVGVGVANFIEYLEERKNRAEIEKIIAQEKQLKLEAILDNINDFIAELQEENSPIAKKVQRLLWSYNHELVSQDKFLVRFDAFLNQYIDAEDTPSKDREPVNMNS